MSLRDCATVVQAGSQPESQGEHLNLEGGTADNLNGKQQFSLVLNFGSSFCLVPRVGTSDHDSSSQLKDYLHSLGKARTAQVQKDARIGEAEAKRDAGIKVSSRSMV